MGWGGSRKGSGRKAKPAANDNVAKLEKPKAEIKTTPATVPASPRQPMFSDSSVMAIIEATREMVAQKRSARTRANNPYVIRPERFGPVSRAVKKAKLAMDDNSSLISANNFAVQAWQAGGLGPNDATEGMIFLGYPYLSELSQRAEYRLFGEITSEEMTRKWIEFRGTDDESMKEEEKEVERNDDDEAAEERREESGEGARTDVRNKEIERKIVELRQFAEEIGLRQHFKSIDAQDQYFGISHLYLDLKGANIGDLHDPENALSIGNGRDEISKGKLGEGCLKGIRTIEPVWCYPIAYNASNPLSPDWYDPQVWYVMGAEVHKTRLIPFISRPVADILKPAYAFGGIAMTQLAQPYVDIWLRTRESVSELIHAFSTMILSTNLGSSVQPGGSGGANGDVIARMMMANMLRDNQGMMIIDKTTEDYKNVAAPISGLDSLQGQAQEHMFSVARIPAVKWTGIQPMGLNATSEGEMRAFNDTIHGRQEFFFRPNLTTVLDIMMISLWGERDPDITFDFSPLHEMTDKERGEVSKLEAETDQIRVDTGIVSQEEVRAKLVADPDSGYHGLDPDDVPELLAEEEQGLIPEGAGKGLEAELAQGGGGPEKPAGGQRPPGKQPSGEDRALALDAAGLRDEVLDRAAARLTRWLALDDGEWEENKHPRDKGGKFTSGGGGGGGAAKPGKTGGTAAPAKPLMMSSLTKVGPQKGSNPGGVYKDKEGTEFYVKKLKSPAHVKSEVAAANLYDIAGVPTLSYAATDAPDHVATKMEKLDKGDVKNLTPEQKKQIQSDYVAHAWLANWDAIGLDYDNMGFTGGKPKVLDTGGALEYRAQGEPKGDKFGTEVNELNTFLDPDLNPQAASVFDGIEWETAKASAKKVLDIPNKAIRANVKAAGGSQELAAKLIERKKSIAIYFGMPAAGESNPEWEALHPRDSSGKFVSKAGGEEPTEGEAEGEEAEAGGKLGEHEVQALLNKTPIAGSNYRKALVKALAHPNISQAGKTKLAENLVTSWLKTAMNATTKGDHKTSASIGKKVQGLIKEHNLDAGKFVENFKAIAAAGKTAPAEPAAEPAKPEPPPTPAKALEKVAEAKANLPKPTDAEMAKAKKGTTLSLGLVPGDKPEGGEYAKSANYLIEKFNEKYSGKTLTDEGQLATKVNDFKALVAAVNAYATVEKTNKAADLKKAQAAEAKKLAEQKAAKKAESEKVMKELGITETEALGFDALVEMIGGSKKSLMESFKNYAIQAEKAGYPISGFQQGLLMNYIDGGYHSINEALREGKLTLAQHVYAKMVNDALEKLPKYTGNVIRGTTLNASQIAKYQAGHVTQHTSFTSSGKGFKFSGNVTYKIKAIGKRGADVSTVNPGEQEVIFKANTMFLVHKVDTVNGHTTIEMEEVDFHG